MERQEYAILFKQIDSRLPLRVQIFPEVANSHSMKKKCLAFALLWIVAACVPLCFASEWVALGNKQVDRLTLLIESREKDAFGQVESKWGKIYIHRSARKIRGEVFTFKPDPKDKVQPQEIELIEDSMRTVVSHSSRHIRISPFHPHNPTQSIDSIFWIAFLPYQPGWDTSKARNCIIKDVSFEIAVPGADTPAQSKEEETYSYLQSFTQTIEHAGTLHAITYTVHEIEINQPFPQTLFTLPSVTNYQHKDTRNLLTPPLFSVPPVSPRHP
jgi:hypothetical protein